MRNIAWPVLKLELHWSLVAGGTGCWYGPPMAWFWEQKLPWTNLPSADGQSAARSAYGVTPEASLLYACAHMMIQHGPAEARLIWFYDLDLLLRSSLEGFAWDEVIQQSRRLHWDAALFATLDSPNLASGRRCRRGMSRSSRKI